jgi:pyridoxine 5-phosphate synthase
MLELHVNIDHVATIRNARRTVEPSPLAAVKILEASKASGITTHLREDRRHINDEDIKIISEYLKESRLGFTFEMGATEEIRSICLNTQANLATLVPEKREELTTEGGLDVISRKDYLKEFIKPIQANNTKISIFVDPETNQIEAAREIGVEYIELHTGTYANLFIKYHAELAGYGAFAISAEEKISYANLAQPVKEEVDRLALAVNHAQSIGLKTNLGHGLTIVNLPALMSQMQNIQELHIGHSIIANSVYYGINRVVNDFFSVMSHNVHN